MYVRTGFGGFGRWEMILIFTVVLLLFGAKRLPEIGSSLGKGIREFKSSVSEIKTELEHPDRQIHNYFVHAVPGVFLFVNWLISEIIIKTRHFFLFIPVILAYTYMNYLESMERNVVLYSFLVLGTFNLLIRKLT